MKAPAPGAWVHRGSVAARGLVISPAAIGEREARRRAIDELRDGATLHALGPDYLCLWSDSKRVDSEGARGTLLVEGQLSERPGANSEAVALLGLPLEDLHLERLAVQPGTLVFARAGRIETHRIADLPRLDASRWIDASGLRPRPVAPLPGTEEAEAFLADEVEEAPRAGLPLGDRFRRGPPEGRDALLDRLAKRKRTPSGPGFFARFEGLLSFFQGSAGASDGGPGGRGRQGMPGSTAGSGSPGDALRHGGPSLATRLRGTLERAVFATRLSAFLGRRHARYFMRLKAMLEGGALDEAMRHAVPLGDPVLGGGGGFLAWLLPGMRRSLDISAPGGTASLLLTPPSLQDSLHALYERAAREFERRGRIEDAAYVWIELLGRDEDGIALLERHGQLRRAAEVAELRKMPADRAIRLWFLAGDRARAIDLARRTGAHGAAIARLEKEHREEAQSLRVAWAEHLAQTGDFASAVEVAREVTEAREQLKEWARLACISGGALHARIVGLRAGLDPTELPELAEQTREICARESTAGDAERRALGDALVEREATSATRALARIVLRATLARAWELEDDPMPRIRRLNRHVGDRALGVDIAFPIQRAPSPPEASSGRVEIRATEVTPSGGLSVLDSLPLADGGFIVALGELGLRILSAQGHARMSAAVPAQRLVPSSLGTRVIVATQRGAAWELSRLELPERRVRPWCYAAIDRFAPTYDGDLWFVSRTDEVLALDALAPKLRTLERWKGMGGEVLGLVHGQRSARFLIAGDPPEAWRVELKSLTLRARDRIWIDATEDCTAFSLDSTTRVLLSDGTMVWSAIAEKAWRILALQSKETGSQSPQVLHVFPPGIALGAIVAGCGWVAQAVTYAQEAVIILRELEGEGRSARICMPGARWVTPSLAAGALVACDDLGRLLRVSLQSLKVDFEERIRV